MPDRINDAASAGREGLRAQLGELEAFAARTEAQGEALPAEAAAMMEKLREIIRALDGLTASLGGE